MAVPPQSLYLSPLSEVCGYRQCGGFKQEPQTQAEALVRILQSSLSLTPSQVEMCKAAQVTPVLVLYPNERENYTTGGFLRILTLHIAVRGNPCLS